MTEWKEPCPPVCKDSNLRIAVTLVVWPLGGSISSSIKRIVYNLYFFKEDPNKAMYLKTISTTKKLYISLECQNQDVQLHHTMTHLHVVYEP